MELKPGYKQTEVGVIPEAWDVDSVGKTFDICNQLRLPLSRSVRERMAGPYPYYGPTGVQGWINEYRVEGEYALIGEDGDNFLKWRNQPMTLLVRGKFNVNNHAHLVRGTKNLTEWFYWFFVNRDITSYLTRQGAGRYKLTKATLAQIPCVLPPESEQRAIATALSDVDALLSALERLIAKKRDLKQATMQQLLIGQTRLPGFHGDWEMKRLGDIADIISGGTPKTNEPSYWNGDIKWCTPTDITSCQSKYLIETERTNSRLGLNSSGARLMSAGALLLCSRATIGESKIAGCEISTNQGFKSLVCLPGMNNEYLYYKMLTMKPQMIERAFGSTFLEISKSNIAALEFSLPDFHEQTAIAAVLTDMDAELAALEQRREKTRAIKQGMMQELLTGRIRLPLPEALKKASTP